MIIVGARTIIMGVHMIIVEARREKATARADRAGPYPVTG
jgi:hypothetical protein